MHTVLLGEMNEWMVLEKGKNSTRYYAHLVEEKLKGCSDVGRMGEEWQWMMPLQSEWNKITKRLPTAHQLPAANWCRTLPLGSAVPGAMNSE